MSLPDPFLAVSADQKLKLVEGYRDYLLSKGINPQTVTVRVDIYKTAVYDTAGVAEVNIALVSKDFNVLRKQHSAQERENVDLREKAANVEALFERVLEAYEEDSPPEVRMQKMLAALKTPGDYIKERDRQVWRDCTTHHRNHFYMEGSPCLLGKCAPDAYDHLLAAALWEANGRN